jgi:glyoxylase-like metal-dependent hydrolase (beta-lactamase superfamily II)
MAACAALSSGRDLLLIEGAGGLAVPLAAAGWDWADFAAAVRADGVVLVDTGLATSSPALVEAVTRISSAPVMFVINTNGHVDHAGGNEAFARKGAVIIGLESAREQGGRDSAAPAGNGDESAAAPAAPPVLTTTDTLALHLNGDRLDMTHVADSHTSSDMVVRWNDADVIALGDIYWSSQYPYIDVESGGSLAGMVAAVEGALARSNARTVVIPAARNVRARAAPWRARSGVPSMVTALMPSMERPLFGSSR